MTEKEQKIQSTKGTDAAMQGVEMIMKPRCTEKAREWDEKTR